MLAPTFCAKMNLIEGQLFNNLNNWCSNYFYPNYFMQNYEDYFIGKNEKHSPDAKGDHTSVLFFS